MDDKTAARKKPAGNRRNTKPTALIGGVIHADTLGRTRKAANQFHHGSLSALLELALTEYLDRLDATETAA